MIQENITYLKRWVKDLFIGSGKVYPTVFSFPDPKKGSLLKNGKNNFSS